LRSEAAGGEEEGEGEGGGILIKSRPLHLANGEELNII
jgi:hypothetical protein